MNKTLLFCASLAGASGVGLGAFAAHALRGRLAPALLAAFETGVFYQLIHALALLALGLQAGKLPAPWGILAGVSFVVGIFLFSGSLYLMGLTGVRWVGAITPLGGLAFIVGWLSLAWAAHLSAP